MRVGGQTLAAFHSHPRLTRLSGLQFQTNRLTISSTKYKVMPNLNLGTITSICGKIITLKPCPGSIQWKKTRIMKLCHPKIILKKTIVKMYWQ